MFEHVTSWRVFAVLHTLHLASEWTQHALRATEWYWSRARRFCDRAPGRIESMLRSLLLPVQPSVGSGDWASFVALDFAVRTLVMLYSLLVSVCRITWLRYGYNRDVFI